MESKSLLGTVAWVDIFICLEFVSNFLYQNYLSVSCILLGIVVSVVHGCLARSSIFMSQSIFILLLIFLFSCLELSYAFSFPIFFSFPGLFKEFIYFLFKGFYHLHKIGFKVSVFQLLEYLGLAVVEKLGSDGTLLWLVLTMLLCWSLNIQFRVIMGLCSDFLFNFRGVGFRWFAHGSDSSLFWPEYPVVLMVLMSIETSIPVGPLLQVFVTCLSSGI